ncbi:MAG: hypothetical protein LBG44_04955 [Gemmatimonadota bacterium]|jgi:hypothetical protein|nr:hypothetical protein [Gemmatimonadota bacterium]
MSDYERNTVLPVSKILELSDRVLLERAGLERTRSGHHGATYSGAEGTAVIEAHPHGAVISVSARTDQPRTSKLDGVVRHLLNQFPYQAGDPPREY